uniref:Uncharacterized protein n=1 Tax=Picea sitchensis TaxID=3332 RepID=B8LQ33_PICSI|nr:unknown [Picea sitchensis]
MNRREKKMEKAPLLEEVEKSDESKQRTEQEPEENEEKAREGLVQKALNQSLASTAHLANLLPTGTVLAFQILCPIFSNSGHCDQVSAFMIECLLVLCALSCFFISFTDSFQGSDGKLHYGLATPKGLWTFENLSEAIPDAGRYQVRFLDFVHAFLSVLVFAAIALLNDNVVKCLYPAPDYQTKEVLDVLPVGMGVFCSLLFVVFPTTRHGIGYPVSSHH